MRFVFRSVIVLFLICSQGCIVENRIPQYESKVCEVHEERMHVKWVPTRYGRGNFKRRLREAPNARLPLPMGCVVRLPRKRFGRIYVCSKCDEQYKLWEKNRE